MTQFYAGQVTIDDLQARETQARRSMAGAVVALGELGESVDQVAALCGLSTAEVRALRKDAAKAGVNGASDKQASAEETVDTDGDVDDGGDGE